MSTSELMGELDNIQSEIGAAEEIIKGHAKRRSEVLKSLTEELKGKVFVRKGHKYTICVRGETYFLKGGPTKTEVPVFD